MRGKERLNQWSLRDYVKNTIMLLIKPPFWLLQLLLFWIPLKKNRILFYSLKQHGYSCNLKYLTLFLRDSADDSYQILWVVRNTEDYNLLRSHGIPAAMLHSKEHFLFRLRAGIVITNDEFYPMCLKRRGQFYINTWHGGINYKKIGYAGLEFTNPLQKLIYRMNNPCPDCFVSGSRSFTETASMAFGFPKNIFLECGLPRNDILFHKKDATAAARVKLRLGIPLEKKVVLYAPTFRKGSVGPEEYVDFPAVRACLGRKFGGEWVVLLRNHYFVHKTLEEKESCLFDVSRYEDMQELLLCSDCLISDYSSCMWDYLLTGNPCFVFAPDMDEYIGTDRSFFIPVEKWPYPVSKSMEELCGCIEGFHSEAFQEKVKHHREECGAFDHGCACESLFHVIKKYKNGK